MLTSPTKKRYIGQSIDIQRRLKEHKHDKRERCLKLKNSLNKYGFDKHIVTILTECAREDLNKFERYYQDVYCTTGKLGLNSKLTGYDDRLGELSQEQKEHLSRVNKGRILPAIPKEVMDERIRKINETKRINGKIGKNARTIERERIRELALMSKEELPTIDVALEIMPEVKKEVKYWNPEHSLKVVAARRRNGTYKWKPESLAKMIATRTGMKATDEHKANISKALKGRKISAQQIEALRQANIGRTPWNKGKPRTEEDKIKSVANRVGKYLGENSARSKIMLNMETGIYYYGCVDAASSINHIRAPYLNEMVAGLKRNKTSFVRV